MLSPPYRKCKLVTSGPWLEVSPIALGDVSIIPESPGASDGGHSIALWAVSSKGDVLCRLGVSELNPAGSSWLHVGTDQPFSSVSIGGDYQVWAVARDGSAFYRGSVSPSQPAGECHPAGDPARRLRAVVGTELARAGLRVPHTGGWWTRLPLPRAAGQAFTEAACGQVLASEPRSPEAAAPPSALCA